MLIILLFLPLLSCSATKDTFKEELVIARLPSVDHIASTFRFHMRTDDLHVTPPTYNIFPRVLGDVVREYGLHSLSLSLTQGYYRVPQWGYAPQPARPNGALVTAVFEDDRDISSRWGHLIDALSGFFCASLTQVQPITTVLPNLTRTAEDTTHAERRAMLSSENVCTENLTPWMKLLPCKSRGLVSLLNAETLLAHANHFSIAVDVVRDCPEDQPLCGSYSALLTLTTVSRFSGDAGNRLDFSLTQLFGSTIPSPCPLADMSDVFVRDADALVGQKATFTPRPTNQQPRDYSHFNLVDDAAHLFVDGTRALQIRAKHEDGDRRNVPTVLPIQTPAITMHTFVAGTGVHAGRFVFMMSNSGTSDTNVVFSQTLPWFVRVYFHTLDFTCDHKPQAIRSKHLTGSVDRGSPSLIELDLMLPSESSCKLTIDFERAFLRWDEFPPDAQHGFPIPPACITFTNVSPAGGDCRRPNETLVEWALPGEWASMTTDKYCSRRTSVYGEPLLVIMPVPDFSMPYNVLCLVCTVLALAFGPIHNLTTRSFSLQTVKPKSLKQRFVDHMKRKFGMKVVEPHDDDEIEDEVKVVEAVAGEEVEREAVVSKAEPVTIPAARERDPWSTPSATSTEENSDEKDRSKSPNIRQKSAVSKIPVRSVRRARKEE